MDLVLRGEHRGKVLQVFIDSELGVTVDLCSEVSRGVSVAIDGQRLIHGPYTLEVSSPGIDRPLSFPWQYKKHVGRKFRVRCRTGDQIVVQSGALLAVNDNGIELETGSSGERIAVLFGDIVEAKVVAPW